MTWSGSASPRQRIRKRSGIEPRLVDLALRDRRAAGAARRLGHERERHHRRAGEVVARLGRRRCRSAAEAPLRREHRQRRLHVDARVAGADRERVRLGGRQAGLERAVDEQAPDLLEGHLADELLDVDAAVAQRAALAVGLGDLGGEGDDALEAGLDFAHRRSLSDTEAGALRGRPRLARRAHGTPISLVPPRRRARGRASATASSRAREVVEAACAGSRRSTAGINAFIEVDGERALAAADAVEPGDRAPFAGVPIAIKANVPVEGYDDELRLAAPRRATARTTRAYLVRRLREAGFVIVGITNMPEFGILPTTEPRHTGPTRNPWDLDAHAGRLVAAARRRRSPPGWCRSPTATTAAARSASRPPAAGSSGSSRAAGGSRAGRTSATLARRERRAHAHGGRDRDRCSTCSAGYEVGDANWAPRPVEPYATSMRRDPGRLRDRDDGRPTRSSATVDPEAIAACA